tara:strand:+ start:6095 stop:6319 length:225 start_codon:yes stop_codon:yes gene_type:complete
MQIILKKDNIMPQGDNTQVPVTEVKWFGETEVFTIGSRKIKVWELLLALLVLSWFMPILTNLSARGSGGKSSSK